MKNIPNWQKEIVKNAIEYDFEIIDDIYYCSDFVEIRGTMGGDVRVYRYYKNGAKYER